MFGVVGRCGDVVGVWEYAVIERKLISVSPPRLPFGVLGIVEFSGVTLSDMGV